MFDLYLVIDEKFCLGRDIYDILRLAAQGGVTMVQIREKNISIKEFIEKASKIKNILKPFHIPLIINDRVDVAIAVKADGIHVGQKDMPFEFLKKIIPQNMITGLSVETMKQAEEAEGFNVDYFGVSPVFRTPTKTNFNEKPWELEGLKQLRKTTKHKLVAIGGINKYNAKDVLMAGADCLAVVSAICSSPQPKEAAEELMKIIEFHRRMI